jgi:hypothetical protein
MKLLHTFFFLSLFSTFGVLSQTPPAKIYPLISTQADVIKMLGEGRPMYANKFLYNLKDHDVIITYYKTGCSTSEEKELKLQSNPVLEVSTIPKAKQKPQDVITNPSLYQRYNYLGNQFLYFNKRDRILVTGTIYDAEEYVDKIFYLLPDSKAAKCVVDYSDNTSGLTILNNIETNVTTEDKQVFPPKVIGIYFEEDSNARKNSILDEFSSRLTGTQDGIGYVVFFSNKNDKASMILQRRKKLLDYLTKKGISCKKLIFIDGGIGGSAGTDLTVVHKTFGLERNIKTVCN